MSGFLLDTCAVLRFANGDPIREPAAGALRDSREPGGRLAVSPMTAWEIAMLAAKGRIGLSIDPETWFDRFRSPPGVTLAEGAGPCPAADVDRVRRDLPAVAHRPVDDRLLAPAAGRPIRSGDQRPRLRRRNRTSLPHEVPELPAIDAKRRPRYGFFCARPGPGPERRGFCKGVFAR